VLYLVMATPRCPLSGHVAGLLVLAVLEVVVVKPW
jgi:hypothetical protein